MDGTCTLPVGSVRIDCTGVKYVKAQREESHVTCAVSEPGKYRSPHYYFSAFMNDDGRILILTYVSSMLSIENSGKT